MTTLIISNDEIHDVIKIVKSIEDSGSETVQHEIKEQKGGFLNMLLGTLGASLLGNLSTGQAVNRAGKVRGTNRAVEWVLRAGYGNKMDF